MLFFYPSACSLKCNLARAAGNPNQVRAVRNRYIEEHSALVDSDTAAWRENFDVILEHLAKEKAAAAAAEPKPPSDPEG